jgi:maltose alpha-D-glucosyltransferase/alpha-amylase
VLSTSASGVLAIRFDWRGTSMVTLHNFADRRARAEFDVKGPRGDLLVDVFDSRSSEGRSGRHTIDLDAYAWRWFRVGSPDNALHRESQ